MRTYSAKPKFTSLKELSKVDLITIAMGCAITSEDFEKISLLKSGEKLDTKNYTFERLAQG